MNMIIFFDRLPLISISGSDTSLGALSCQVSHYTIWTHGVLILSELILHKIHRLALPQFLIYLFFYCIKDSFKNILKNRNGVIYSRI